jgi:4-amino-4-deoxy-L-arabinose transferase-like glycosyltransferase
MTRAAKLLLVPVLLLQVGFFGFVAAHRFIDGDEGAFLLASRLVLAHKTPYLDFFYQQAPLLPYAYALWMKVAGISWFSGRAFTVLLTSLLGLLLYRHVCEQTGSWLAGISAVVLFASSTLVFAWFSVVKTYSLSGLFLFCAYLAITRLSAARPKWPLAVAGLWFGLSVDTRSYLLLLTPLFLWWILHNGDTHSRRKSTLWFLGGLAVGLAPCLFLFLPSPDTFLFNNLRYHALRSNLGLIGWWQQKVFVLVELFLGAPEGNGLQWSILFFISVGFIFSIRRRGYAPRLAFQIALILGFICLLPTPAYLQYFSVCVPFLIVSAVCVVSDFFTRLGSRREKLLATIACVAVMVGYLVLGAFDLRSYLVTGDGVPGVRTALDRGDWRLQRVIAVSHAVDQVAAPGEFVASFWPGDILESRANTLPGMENPFALQVAAKLTPAEHARYHITSVPQIEDDIAAHRARVVVLRNQISTAFAANEIARAQQQAATFKSLLEADGYTLFRSFGGISIYVHSGS